MTPKIKNFSDYAERGVSMREQDLRHAAQEYAEAMLHSLPAAEECQHDFSQKFVRRMAGLIRRMAHPGVTRALRGAACLMLATLLLFAATFAVRAEAQSAFAGWLHEAYGVIMTRIHYGGAGKENAPKRYAPGWVPEGCTYEKTVPIVGGELFFYTDAQGKNLTFSYSYPREEGKQEVYMLTETCIAEEVQVNGREATLYVPEDGSNLLELVWMDKDREVLFVVSCFGTKEEILRIAEGIVEICK